jgi:hypothetical protein
MSGAASGVRPEQRFSPSRPCPICGGHDRMRRGESVRCYGFISEDGKWAHCTREEFAGDLPRNSGSDGFAHKLAGNCRCGVRHDLAAGESRAEHAGRSRRRKSTTIAETYDYTDQHGELLYQAVRLEPKGFYQRRPDGRGGWINDLAGVRRVLYGLSAIIAADRSEPVLILEGERDVDTAQSIGFVATTNAGGAGKWRSEYSDALRGRPVVVIPDNDAPGRKHAEQVARSLYGKAASVKILELPGLREGGDLSDWLESAKQGAVELRRQIVGAEKWTPPEERDDGRVLLGRAICEGVEPPAELVEDVILEGKAHAIYAGAGIGKTFVMLWIVLEVLKRGAPVLLYDAENGLRLIAERLEQFGADPEQVDDLLYYYPYASLPTTDEGRQIFEAKLERIRPALVCFDSWISFLAANGLDENSSNDIATFATHYLSPARSRGVATLMVDHVPHEAKHARGSTRKKDEVDVMWSLARLMPFDRERVGEIVLHREKDRDGWLPLDVKFSVGGTEEGGFLFSRSAGTFEVEGEDGLKDSERKSLEALETFGESGAKAAEWQRRAEERGIKRRTFYNTLNGLKRKGRALQENNLYYASSANKCNSSAMHQNAPTHDSGAKVQQPYRAAPLAPTGTPEDDYSDLADQLAADEKGSA